VPARNSSRSLISTEREESGVSWGCILRSCQVTRERFVAGQCCDLNWERKVAVGLSVGGIMLVLLGTVGLVNVWSAGHLPRAPKERHSSKTPPPLASGMTRCSDTVPCPVVWRDPGNDGGFYCTRTGGCRPFADGHFPDCPVQCQIGGTTVSAASSSRTPAVTMEARTKPPPQPMTAQATTQVTTSSPAEPTAAPHVGQRDADSTVIIVQGGASADAGKALQPLKLEKAGAYDLRVVKGGKLLGCAAPIGLFPGNAKYGCSAEFATAKTCDAANFPVKDTKYVAAVHAGCETEQGRGTYGYAYDDGVGLKQCASITKYEWVLCPKGTEGPIDWEAKPGPGDTVKRFRITNDCEMVVWIQQAGAQEQILPHDEIVVKIQPHTSYTYSIPNRGLPSTRFLPKTGCSEDGNGCDVQSMPPCPPEGCDLPVDTKFEASWGCVHASGDPAQDRQRCALTGQGNPSTFQDWWDGSAVDGWTLPFSVLVDDGGHGLTPDDSSGSPSICGNVVCANLDAAKLCPKDEYLVPVDSAATT